MANLSDLMGGASFEIIDLQVFASSGTWTKPASAKPGDIVVVDLWGGGGSGFSNNTGLPPGGAGGAHVRAEYSVTSLDLGEAVTVGAGGAAVTVYAATPNWGGNSQFKRTKAYGGMAGTSYVSGGGRAGAGFSDTLPHQYVGGTSGHRLYSPNPWAGGLGTSEEEFRDAMLHGGGANWAGRSIWGGGGGGTGAQTEAHLVNTPGGTSEFGGSGGGGSSPNAAAPAEDGEIPGGGGGGGYNQNSGAGARGEVRIYVIRGAVSVGDLVLPTSL